MACDSCYEKQTEQCEDIVLEDAGLTASTSYTVSLQRPGQSNIFQVTAETDADGKLTIPVDDLPEGLIVAGTFLELTAKKEDDDVEFTFGDNTYDCVLLKFVNIQDLSS